MDVFSSIKNVTQKSQNLDSISNNNTVKQTQVERINKLSNEQSKNINDTESLDKQRLKDELRKITEELNKALNPLNTSLKFRFNDKIDELTVEVVDVKKDEVIRKFPNDEALRLMEKMREIVGLLFDKKG